jgi:hypothetical protein
MNSIKSYKNFRIIIINLSSFEGTYKPPAQEAAKGREHAARAGASTDMTFYPRLCR